MKSDQPLPPLRTTPSLQAAARRLPASLRWSLAVWAASRLALAGWGALFQAAGLSVPGLGERFYHGVAPLNQGWQAFWLGPWQRWDAIHYQRIVTGGYSQPELSAFFPLYPLLSRALHTLTGLEPLAAMLVVSNLAALLALAVLYQMTGHYFSSAAARRAVTALAVFPSAFFLYAPYADGLALALSLLAFHAAQTGRLRLALAAGVLAGLAHPTVVPLVLALGLLLLGEWKGIPLRALAGRLLAAAGPALGTGLFLAWRAAQGFPAYPAVQYQYWGWKFWMPWEVPGLVARLFDSSFLLVSGWSNLALLAAALAVTAWSWKRFPPALRLYQAGMLVFLLLTLKETEPLASWGRHLLLVFPLFMGLGLWASTPRRRLAALALALGMQLFLAGEYFLWIWVG